LKKQTFFPPPHNSHFSVAAPLALASASL